MKSGRIVQHGTAQQLYEEPIDLFAARFFCDFNELEGIVEKGFLMTEMGSFVAPKEFSQGQRVIVCIRPQSVTLHPVGQYQAETHQAGRIVSKCFLGDVDLVHVAVNGLQRPLQARLRGGRDFYVGQDVGVEVNAKEILVFAASDA
jgi:iron(III) transport system ATP-binding protein